LKYLEKNPVDLLFLDIEMPDMTGLDLLEKLDFHPAIIVTTSNKDYALDAFEYDVTDFLLKPVNLPRLQSAVEKVKTAPKVNKKETKKFRAALIHERNKLTSPLKKEVEKLEKFIIDTEDLIALHHKELIAASNSGESSKVMELSQLVSKEEKDVEEKFERLEVVQNELDELLELYEAKLAELELMKG